MNQPPSWSQFNTPEEFELFLSLVKNYFDERDIPNTIENGIVTLKGEAPFDNQLGLANLAQVCHQSDQSNWSNSVKAHFDAMALAHKESAELEHNIRNLDYAMPLLCIRIYSTEYIENIGFDKVVSRPVSDDIHAVLVYDFESSIKNVQPDEIEVWGFSLDELFDIAANQTWQKYAFHITEQPLQEESIWFVTCEHFYTASILLNLKAYPQLMGVHGSIVAIPNRHAAIFYPIQSHHLQEAMGTLFRVVYSMYAEGPGSLSDQLYLQTEDQLIRIPSHVEDTKLQVYPPEELIQLMDLLSGDQP